MPDRITANSRTSPIHDTHPFLLVTAVVTTIPHVCDWRAIPDSGSGWEVPSELERICSPADSRSGVVFEIGHRDQLIGRPRSLRLLDLGAGTARHLSWNGSCDSR